MILAQYHHIRTSIGVLVATPVAVYSAVSYWQLFGLRLASAFVMTARPIELSDLDRTAVEMMMVRRAEHNQIGEGMFINFRR